MQDPEQLQVQSPLVQSHWCGIQKIRCTFKKEVKAQKLIVVICPQQYCCWELIQGDREEEGERRGEGEEEINPRKLIWCLLFSQLEKWNLPLWFICVCTGRQRDALTGSCGDILKALLHCSLLSDPVAECRAHDPAIQWFSSFVF